MRALEEICKRRYALIESVRARVRSVIVGERPAVQKGLGIEVEDFREYVYGDDFRHIDWKVTARMPYVEYPKLYVREYREEKALNVLVMLDCTESMSYGVKWASAIAALIAISEAARKYRDRLGIYTLGLRDPLFIKPQSPEGLVEYFFSRVCEGRIVPTGRERLDDSIGRALMYLTRRYVTILVTDVAHQVEELVQVARLLRERSSAVYVVLVVDPRELELPPLGLALLEDMEGWGVMGVQSSDESELITAILRRHLEEVECSLQSIGVPFVRVVSPASVIYKLRKLLVLYSKSREAVYV